MKQLNIQQTPKILAALKSKSKEVGFSMSADENVGTLLRTLITSKPKANILELGTGIGLSLAWMIDGMDSESRLITVDNDPKLIDIVNEYFGADKRIEIVCAEGSEWIKSYEGGQFDLIFADAWPGKYSETRETLELVKPGGFYVIDDMMTQPNWPDGHQENAAKLLTYLEYREDFNLTRIDWSSGIVLCVKKG